MGILLEAGSKMFVFLALMFAMAAAAPSKQTDPEWAGEPTYGEWVEVVEQPDQREPALAANWWDWDHEAVTEGIFKNENIMIHVGQNLFNFIFTTLAWFTVSQIYSLTADVNGRQQRSLTISEAADDVLEAIRAFEHKNK